MALLAEAEGFRGSAEAAVGGTVTGSPEYLLRHGQDVVFHVLQQESQPRKK